MTKKKSCKAFCKKIVSSCQKNYWIISTVVLAVLLVLSFSLTSSGISANVAGEKVLAFANGQGAEAKLIEVKDDGALYQVVLEIQGQPVPVYVTKDGKNLAPSLIPLEAPQATPSPSQRPAPANVPKSDKPKVELFVMTHCPYGTQAEKGFIPAIQTLGDSIDANIKFVHYFMHEAPGQEPDETPIQVCIREEQSDKYLDYLSCFLEDGNSDRCLTETNIDTTSLESCKTQNADGYYAADSEASQGYGVGGSPTLVINGVIASTGRDATSILNTICSSFTTAPEECNTELSSASPSPGFGYDASGSATTAQC
jgi:hypothetical protein